MKRVAFVAVAEMVAAPPHSALAAALGVRAPPPVYAPPVAVAPTWTGIYIGFNGGWGWRNNNNNTAPFAPLPAGRFFTPFTPFTVGGNNNNANGPVFGAQLGYNYQAGNWV